MTAQVRLNLEQARDSRDALTKSIYGKLFSRLVERCNEKLVDDAASAAFIGILDIFGFETFAVNSFEQLCINYANERLQQHFIVHTFEKEQARACPHTRSPAHPPSRSWHPSRHAPSLHMPSLGTRPLATCRPPCGRRSSTPEPMPHALMIFH